MTIMQSFGSKVEDKVLREDLMMMMWSRGMKGSKMADEFGSGVDDHREQQGSGSDVEHEPTTNRGEADEDHDHHPRHDLSHAADDDPHQLLRLPPLTHPPPTLTSNTTSNRFQLQRPPRLLSPKLSPHSSSPDRSSCPLPSFSFNSSSSSTLSQSSLSTQPPTSPSPLIVKETYHGSLSDLGLLDGQRKLNHYLLLKTIGRGSFGSVELALDLNSPDQSAYYAIKEYSKSRIRKRTRFLHNPTSSRQRHRQGPQLPLSHQSPPGRQSSDGMQLVKTEVAIMKKLAHPNIVSLLEVIDTDDDSLFFVLELCRFGPVMQIQIGKTVSPLDEARARNVFRQVLLGIEYLHFNQIIHRDIKPDNILYFDDPQTEDRPICKIVDFGVSESFSNSGDDTLHKSAGSPAFLAPELCSGTGEGIHGKIIDIWAMGVTLYAMVCGRLPFEDHSPITLCEKIMNEPVEYPVGLSQSLVDLLKRLLDKCPDTRIQMCKLRVHRWVTDDEREPLPVQSSHLTPIDPPTPLEIAEAFKSIRSLTTMLKAVGRFRAKRRSRSSVQLEEPAELTSSTYLGQLVQSPVGSFEVDGCRPGGSSGPIGKLSFETRKVLRTPPVFPTRPRRRPRPPQPAPADKNPSSPKDDAQKKDQLKNELHSEADGAHDHRRPNLDQSVSELSVTLGRL